MTPWKTCGKQIVAQDGTPIAAVLKQEHVALLAAAPEMLEALKAACAYDDCIQRVAKDGQFIQDPGGSGIAASDELDRLYDAWVGLSRAAIAKAERKS